MIVAEKSQTLGDMNTNVQYDNPMPSKEKMKTGDCCGNRPGFLDQNLKSSRGKNRFRGIVDPDLESSRKVYRVRGIVEKSLPGPRICRPGVEIVEKNLSGPRNRRPRRPGRPDVREKVDQGLKSSTRSETSSTGSEDSSTRTAGCPRKKNVAE
ncbi:hypothetical protein DMA11_24720 [Marinilabiliaceae bacterium JC017]|nr:hypothetical protein DMA11_24720 [Marinilabiliaceae bacterium JC017]